MPRLPATPVDSRDRPLRSSILGPTVRRDIADLNREYLEISLAREMQDDPRFAWSEPVRRALLDTDPVTRECMAASPFAFFELHLPPPEPRGIAEPGRVEDGGFPLAAGAVTGRCASFVHLALFLAWRLADAEPLATRIALGLPPAAELRLNEMSPSQLVQLVAWPGLVRPRWPDHRRFWSMLAGASGRNSVIGLQWAHCIGICLLGTAPAAGAGPPSGGREAGRRLRS
ncbi:MAG: hypothetical protein WBO04_15435 [Steroidobacteraceae bacterium]